jgi:hypothetical protein
VLRTTRAGGGAAYLKDRRAERAVSIFKTRVKDTTASGGTGAKTLDEAAPGGFQGFDTFGDGNDCVAVIVGAEGGLDANKWEVGLYTVGIGASLTLTPVEVTESSNGGAAVNWTAGALKHVFCVPDAGTLNALVAGNASAAGRPAHLQAGALWWDTSAAPWVLKAFDGADDIALGELDPAADTFTPYYQGTAIGGTAPGTVPLWEATGWRRAERLTKAANYTVAAADAGKAIVATAAGVTLDADASALGAGFAFGAACDSFANAVTVDDTTAALNFFAPGHEAVESITLSVPRLVAWFQSDGTNWHVAAAGATALPDLPALTAPAPADAMSLWDDSAKLLRRMILTDLFKVVGLFTDIGATLDQVNDKLLIFDATDGLPKQTSLGNVGVGDGSVTRPKLSTAVGGASGSISSGSDVSVTMDAYSFFPMLHAQTNDVTVGGHTTDGGSADAPRFILQNNGVGGNTYDVDWRFVTA